MTRIQDVGYFPVNTTKWMLESSSNRVGLVLLAAIALVLVAAPNSHAVVAVFDGFGDGDRNNDGTAFEEGVDVYDSTDPNAPGQDGFYEPVLMTGGVSSSVFDPNTLVAVPSVVENASDTGIRWTGTGGRTSSGDISARPRIVNDAAGFLPETVGNQGFFNAISSETQHIPALDSGLALGFESAGRTRSISGFFEEDLNYDNGKQGTIELGPNVGDQVKVSFDFRVWMSASNFNGNANNHVPTYGTVRFGVHYDADDQLGDENLFAGPADPNGAAFTAVDWGEEDGWFRGELSGPDVSGDPGYFVRMPLVDKDTPFDELFGPFSGGQGGRIVEETNPNSGDLFMAGNGVNNGGDTQTVAIPSQDPNNTNFVNLDTLSRYNLSLTFERFDETGGSLDPNVAGDNIRVTLTVKDLDTLVETSLTGFDTLFDPNGVPFDPNHNEAGFDSDAWDYFSIDVAGASAGDDMDYILDNFMVEVFGSNESDYFDPSADFDGDGVVSGLDFLIYQQNIGLTGQVNNSNGDANGDGVVNAADLAIYEAQYGTSPLSASVAAVPEPASILMFGLGGLLALGRPRRSRSV